jgi:hypothetical protein
MIDVASPITPQRRDKPPRMTIVHPLMAANVAARRTFFTRIAPWANWRMCSELSGPSGATGAASAFMHATSSSRRMAVHQAIPRTGGKRVTPTKLFRHEP